MANARSYVVSILTIFMLWMFFQKHVSGSPARINDYDAVEIGFAAPDDIPEPENSQDPKTFCALPPKRGHCRALLLRWRYNPSSKECVEFKFGGCDGNSNNFHTKKQCLKTCDGF